MNNSKILPILKALSRKEFLEFGRYLHNGFFTRDTHILALYDYLKKQSKDWKPEKLDKEYMRKKIVTKQSPYSIKQLNHVISDLYQQLENYLIWKEIQARTFQRKQLLLSKFQELNVSHLYFLESQKLNKELDKTTYQDAIFHLQKMTLAHNQYYHPNQKRFETEEDHLTNAINHLELYYVTNSLQYMIELYFQQKNISETSNYLSFSTLLERLQQPPFDHLPYFQINKALLQLLLTPSNELYKKYKDLVFKYIKSTHTIEQYQILKNLLNYTIKASRTGNIYYGYERLRIYKFGLEENILLENNCLHPSHFLNIVDTAIGIEEFDYIEQFIKDYEETLHEDFRGNTVSLVKAQLAFAQSNFDLTIQLLTHVEFKELQFAIIVKCRLLQSYLELYNQGKEDYFNPIQNLITSFRKFLFYHKEDIPHFITSNLNFLKILKMLFERKLSKENISTELQSIQLIAYKTWLMKMLEGYQPSNIKH